MGFMMMNKVDVDDFERVKQRVGYLDEDRRQMFDDRLEDRSEIWKLQSEVRKLQNTISLIMDHLGVEEKPTNYSYLAKKGKEVKAK